VCEKAEVEHNENAETEKADKSGIADNTQETVGKVLLDSS